MDDVSPSDSKGSNFQGRSFVVSVNEKGRMTLPVKIRELLHMPPEPGMVELLVEEDGSITIQGRVLTVAETAGAVSPLDPSKDWKEVERAARDEAAERYLTKFGR